MPQTKFLWNRFYLFSHDSESNDAENLKFSSTIKQNLYNKNLM